MTKPWELIPGGVDDAPVQTTTAQPWDREPPVSAKAPAQPLHPNHVPKNSLTRAEHEQYFAFSHTNALARLDAENFEMEMRLDFAERRLKRLQGD